MVVLVRVHELQDLVVVHGLAFDELYKCSDKVPGAGQIEGNIQLLARLVLLFLAGLV